MMLENYGVVKYSALTARTDVLRPVKTGSFLGPGPVRASLDLMSGVKRVDEAVRAKPMMLTSTVVKPGLFCSPQTTIDLAASPVLPRDQPSPASPRLAASAKSPARSFLTADDSELAATVSEVTSPEYLEKLHRRYGALSLARAPYLLCSFSRYSGLVTSLTVAASSLSSAVRKDRAGDLAEAASRGLAGLGWSLGSTGEAARSMVVCGEQKRPGFTTVEVSIMGLALTASSTLFTPDIRSRLALTGPGPRKLPVFTGLKTSVLAVRAEYLTTP